MDPRYDPLSNPTSVETERLAYAQRIARVVLSIAFVLLGIWVLNRFLSAIAWGAVLAIALWPFYSRLVRSFARRRGEGIFVPLLVTALIGLVFTVPFVYIVIEGAREVRVAAQFLGEAQRRGIPVPDWMPQFPLAGPAIE